ncbi:carbon-nitrogen hydrolase family protein, partial [Gordonia sp. Z-3]|uniref:carbon-nitrogen hydrolase family protein n=1 Tax=Gordonia sp. Z-3 TaxID=3115408 RepID=UPI002E281362
MKVAAVQLEAVVANISENLARCERLVIDAVAAGAEWVMLPEFFSTGMAFDDALASAALPPDGVAVEMMMTLAKRNHITIGGSFLCRDADGHTRNAYFLVSPSGEILGRHDKDLPTMWENCYYIGGDDEGVIDLGDGRAAGAAVCWEFMRSQTARRLRGRVDVIVGGSAWWSSPSWHPKKIFEQLENSNSATATGIAPAMARLVGAPVIHAAHTGTLHCRIPWLPLRYRGHLEGGAMICTADGRIQARRDAWEGPGFALADVDLQRAAPTDAVSEKFWLHPRGAIPAAMWSMQRVHGKRYYKQKSYAPSKERTTACEARRDLDSSRGAIKRIADQLGVHP